MSALSVPEKRIWELDLLKGIALIFMIWDHIVFDLYGFFGFDMSSLGFLKEGIGEIAAVIFMTVCGISVTLGSHNLKHGGIVFSIGMFLTLFTFIFDKITNSGALIMFGILHFLGIAMIIGHFVKKLPIVLIAVTGLISLCIGCYFKTLTVSVQFLFPFGLTADNFYSSDYFPLFPNLFFVFVGIIIGKTLYKKKNSIFKRRPKNSLMCFLGRHTLIVYVIHQPIVYGIIYLISLLIR